MVNLKRLEELMQDKRWGVGELAQYSGVKYDTVYSLKSGRRPNTTAGTLTKIADALGTSVDYLLGESEDKAPTTQKLPEPIRQLADIAGRLSEVRQEELLRIASALEKLEREQAEHPLPKGTMREMLEIAERLRERGSREGDDLRELLQALLRNSQRPWLIDLGNGQEPDQPQQND